MSSDKDIFYLLNHDYIVVGYGEKEKLHVFPYRGKDEKNFSVMGKLEFH